MNKKLLLLALLPLFIIGGCKKEVTETKSTTVNIPYTAPAFNFWGTWLRINEDPNTTIQFYVMDEKISGCTSYRQDEYGYRRSYYSDMRAVDGLISYDYNGLQPYTISGDTMTVYDRRNPGEVDELLLRVPADTFDPSTWITDVNVTRQVKCPQDNLGYGYSSFSTCGIDGDYLYVSVQYKGTHKFYKLNTLTGGFVDSVNAPFGTWHSLYYKASSNKLYNTRYSGTQTLQQRTGLMGANSNLSTNSLNSIRAISTNGTSGTVYAYRSGTLYSGSEGGNFNSLYSFTGQYPRSVVYYKGDQFLGVYNGTLVLFEISPEFKIIKQFRFSGTVDAYSMYESVSTNGSDIWVCSRSRLTNAFSYYKVTLP